MGLASHLEWFQIYGFLTGEKGCASVQGLCDYMQEAAGNHAAHLGLSIARLHSEGVAWVLTRQRLRIARMPKMNQKIAVETWPVGIEGLQFRRDFIIRSEQGDVLASAASYWAVVSLLSRKVVRIPKFITSVALRNPETNSAFDDCKTRLPSVPSQAEPCIFRARLADVDSNLHVNNIRYMEWVLETVPEAVRQSKNLCDFEIFFRAEAYRNDHIEANAREEPAETSHSPTRFLHSLIRHQDKKELVRARTQWC